MKIEHHIHPDIIAKLREKAAAAQAQADEFYQEVQDGDKHEPKTIATAAAAITYHVQAETYSAIADTLESNGTR